MGMPRDSELDFLLTMALEVHDEDLVCSACGGYRDVCQDPESDGWYEVDDSIICFATAARQQYEKDEGKDVEPGTLTRIIDLKREKAPSRPRTSRPSQPVAGQTKSIAKDTSLG